MKLVVEVEVGRWWVGCYVWYSDGPGPQPARPFLVVANVTAHQSTASVPITVLLRSSPLLCGFYVPVNGLNSHVLNQWRIHASTGRPPPPLGSGNIFRHSFCRVQLLTAYVYAAPCEPVTRENNFWSRGSRCFHQRIAPMDLFFVAVRLHLSLIPENSARKNPT